MLVDRSKITRFFESERSQFTALLLLSFIALLFTAFLISQEPLIFKRFIGDLNPGVAIPGAIFIGFVLLSVLLYNDWSIIYKKGNLIKLVRYSISLLLFAAVSVIVDLYAGFSEDMNILFPMSLLFYPLIGFIVEIIFHVIPFSTVLLLTSAVFDKKNHRKAISTGIILIALLEPTYQVYYMESFPYWAMTAVWINLFIFNIVQLQIFRKYDFFSMYLFRILYYSVWHILWGQIRLEFIF